MVSRAPWLAVLSVVVSMLGIGAPPCFCAQSQPSADEAIIQQALAGSPDLRNLLESDDWLERLYNPALTTEDEIRRTAESYERILACLARLERRNKLPDGLVRIEKFLTLFLHFAPGGKRGRLLELPALLSTRELVDLQTSNDPAVVKLRDEMGLPAPKGFVYVRRYHMREAMPSEVKLAFEDKSTRAVTILCRYVAVLDEIAAPGGRTELESRTLPKVLSHELVHAYISSLLPLSESAKLPEWFHEGCAIHLSGSGGTNVVLQQRPTFRGTRIIQYTTRDPKEYHQYKLAFEYAEAELGYDGMLQALKRAIETRNAEELLSRVGVTSYEQLVERGASRRGLRNTLKWTVATVALLAAGFWLYSKLPKDGKLEELEEEELEEEERY